MIRSNGWALKERVVKKLWLRMLSHDVCRACLGHLCQVLLVLQHCQSKFFVISAFLITLHHMVSDTVGPRYDGDWAKGMLREEQPPAACMTE